MLDIQIVHSWLKNALNLIPVMYFDPAGSALSIGPFVEEDCRFWSGFCFPPLDSPRCSPTCVADSWAGTGPVLIPCVSAPRSQMFCISLANPHGIRTGPGPAQESRTHVELHLRNSRGGTAKPRLQSAVFYHKRVD